MCKSRRCLTAVFLVLCLLVNYSFAQQRSADEHSVPLTKLERTWRVFAVDASANREGKLTSTSANTFVAGPIELHLPQAKAGQGKVTRGIELWAPAPQHRSVDPMQRSARPPSQLPSEPSGPSHPSREHVTPANYAETLPPLGDNDPHDAVTDPHDAVTDLFVPQSDGMHEIIDPSEMGMAMPAPPHHVIRAPRAAVEPAIQSSAIQSSATFASGSASGGIHEHAAAFEAKYQETHPEHSSMRRRVQPEPATIPNATQRGVWKQPYSYGYFGASGSRHWSLQYGHREQYSQWTRR